MNSKSSSKVKIFNFNKMIPEHPRKVSKHPGMFCKLPKHVFDDFESYIKFREKNVLSQNYLCLKLRFLQLLADLGVEYREKT